MRMTLPPKRLRIKITKLLVAFFCNKNRDGFKEAVRGFCDYYHVRRPKTEWVSASKLGKNAALTFDNGILHLIEPAEWCRMPSYYDNSVRQWIFSFYHEMYHFLHWVNDENKADEYARRMLQGLEKLWK